MQASEDSGFRFILISTRWSLTSLPTLSLIQVLHVGWKCKYNYFWSASPFTKWLSHTFLFYGYKEMNDSITHELGRLVTCRISVSSFVKFVISEHYVLLMYAKHPAEDRNLLSISFSLPPPHITSILRALSSRGSLRQEEYSGFVQILSETTTSSP